MPSSSKSGESHTNSIDFMVCDQLVPSAQDGKLNVTLAQFPLHAPAGINAIPHPGAPLAEPGENGGGYPALYAWPKSGVNSSRYPLLACVMEGEADVRFGVTKSMAKAGGNNQRKLSCYTLQMPRNSLLLLPAGVPYSDGVLPHWEREGIERAHSVILWIHFVAQGALLHSCSTRNAEHTLSFGQFVMDPRLTFLVEMLVDEMKQAGGQLGELGHSFLLSILLCLMRGCDPQSSSKKTQTTVQAEGALVETPANLHARVVERAAQYIDMHLREPLTVDQIASHSYVSKPQLNRLFRTAFNSSVMDYVTDRRIAQAKNLLHQTELSVTMISWHVGYVRPSYFSRVFTAKTGLSPSQYRRSMGEK